MSLFDAAMEEQKAQILSELEKRLWERLEPRIEQELFARYLSIADTARYLKVSEQTVRRLIREKTVPSFRVRNQIFLRQIDIDQWIQTQINERR
jgi:excisionase family DNA binding protein